MRKIVLMIIGIVLAAMPLSAQNYRNSKYYNPRTGHLDYGHHKKDAGDIYYGLRIGPAFSYVNSDDSRLDGGKWQTGLNVGFVAGIPLSDTTPLYLETGLSYIEKGGKKNLAGGKKMTYDLNYLEIPIVAKYKYDIDSDLSIQPFFGGYFGVGVSGKIKNFEEREAESSFRSSNFRRADGGLRLGCGLAYDMFYCDLTYDIGLANICHDTFDASHNGSIQLNFGVNF